MTISELKFESLCKDNMIEYRRLPENDQKTPDYEVGFAGQPIAAEIKELTPNDAELEASRKISTGQLVVQESRIFGDRIRQKIESAKKQLRNHAEGKCPAVLILYDARPPFIRGIYPSELAVAMYGALTLEYNVPKDMGQPIQYHRAKFGKDSKLRTNSHTFISALGVLREMDPSPNLHLDLYHNLFADMPLPLDSLVNYPGITSYTIDPNKGDEYRDWLRIEP